MGTYVQYRRFGIVDGSNLQTLDMDTVNRLTNHHVKSFDSVLLSHTLAEKVTVTPNG